MFAFNNTKQIHQTSTTHVIAVRTPTVCSFFRSWTTMQNTFRCHAAYTLKTLNSHCILSKAEALQPLTMNLIQVKLNLETTSSCKGEKSDEIVGIQREKNLKPRLLQQADTEQTGSNDAGVQE